MSIRQISHWIQSFLYIYFRTIDLKKMNNALGTLVLIYGVAKNEVMSHVEKPVLKWCKFTIHQMLGVGFVYDISTSGALDVRSWLHKFRFLYQDTKWSPRRGFEWLVFDEFVQILDTWLFSNQNNMPVSRLINFT